MQRYKRSYPKHRGLDLTLYSGVWVHDDVYTFGLWNLAGQLVGYQQYRPQAGKERYPNPKDMRYYTYLPSKSNTAWGLELLNPKQRYLLLVEGIFDAVKLHNLGVNCLAVLANNPKPLKSWLQSLGYILVPVCEGDKAGRKLASLASTSVVEYLPEGVDVGDMTQEEVNERFSRYKV